MIQRAATPLSAKGQSQAAKLAQRIAEIGVGRILSSDLRRAEMTAKPISRETRVPMELEPLLQERNFGELRGTPYSELSRDPFAADSAPPGGETWQAFHARVDDAWDHLREVAAGTEGNLAVVTHGLMCTALVTRHFDRVSLGEGREPPLRFDNTGLTLVEDTTPFSVLLLNCTAHLEEGE